MAATETAIKIRTTLLLNNGTSPTGNVITKSMAIGPEQSLSGYDPDKILALADAIAPILAKSVYMVKTTKESEIS